MLSQESGKDFVFLNGDVKRAVEYLGDVLRGMPEEISVSHAARALLFWATKLRLQYGVASSYPVSLTLRNYKPHRDDVTIEFEALQATKQVINMLGHATWAAMRAPDPEQIEFPGPMMTIQEFDEMIRKQIMGE